MNHINTKTSSSSHGFLSVQECGWAQAHDVFAVAFAVSLNFLSLQSVHDHISFSATSSVTPVMLTWDFGDHSPRVDQAGTEVTAATHKYGLPGQYSISLTASAGNKEVREKGYQRTAIFMFCKPCCQHVF